MHRVSVGLLVACLMAAAAAPSASQGPSPGPVGMGGRVEMPEYGFALTLPDDWLWVRHSVEGFDTIAAMIEGLTGTVPGEGFGTFYEWLDEPKPLLGIFMMDGGTVDQTCYVGPVALSDSTLDEWAADMARDLEARSEVPDDIVLADVYLPAGRGIRIDYRYSGFGSVSTYWLGRDPVFYAIGCQSFGVPPEDRWLSIAETIDFLPDTSAEPAATDG